jgi:hypothetical protein
MRHSNSSHEDEPISMLETSIPRESTGEADRSLNREGGRCVAPAGMTLTPCAGPLAAGGRPRVARDDSRPHRL